jgi:hypothetical protein
MRWFSFLAVTMLALLAVSAGFAQAQTQAVDDGGGPGEAVTVTPFVSLGSFVSSRVGAAIAFPWTDKTSIEVEVGYRRQELNALSAHLSLLHDLPRIGRVTPYVAAGIGLEEYGVAVPQPGNGVATLARTSVAVNAGGGVKVPVDDRWGVRTDARWFNGLGEQAGEHWRVFNGVTLKAGPR